FNKWRVKNGKGEVSLSGVKRRLNMNELKKYWYPVYHGKSAFENKFMYRNTRERASCRNALWNGDGTKVNYYYKDARGNIKANLDFYVIIDAHSERILGYSFTTNGENARVIRSALKMAVD
ncbi:hypothetical protein, partial [Flammeovirga sp. OC4]|uniref:hypothetical protein n=1 Tax=Flammeovirga sp. OC4 TaxID=1382345 RepID=UPI0005C5F6C2